MLSVPSRASARCARLRARIAAGSTVARVRLVTFLLAFLSALGTIVPIATAPNPLPFRLAAAGAAIALASWWLLGLRRGDFPLAGEPLEALAVFVVLRVAPGHPLLPLCGLLFRSLYADCATAALRCAMWSGALIAAGVPHDANVLADQLPRVFALILATGAMQGLLAALTRLEASEQRLGSLIEHSTDIVTVLDRDGRIGWQARSLTPVLGYDHRDWLGTRLTEHVDPDDAQTLEMYIARARDRPGYSELLELRLSHRNGQQRWFEIAASNRLHDPNVQGFVLNIRDATDRRRLERERAESERLRERIAAERERRDLQTRLQQAQRLESVGALAGGIAHDFNNLLAAILNSVPALGAALPEHDEAREDLELIARAAHTGAELTEKLLAFARRKPPRPHLLDASQLIAATDVLLARTLGAHIELRRELADDLWPLTADPSDIEQMILNLAINARDALPPDGGQITTSTRNTEIDEADALKLGIPPGRYVQLTVTDNGCGIDPDTLSHVWEPYFTTKPPGQGNGLGLATVHGIAQQSGGAVAITSQPGHGTAAHIYLPATDATGPAAARSETDDRPAIMLVETETETRDIVRRTLERAGYYVWPADSADAALGLLTSGHHPDLLITDVIMPGAYGDELATRARRLLPGLAVLYMVGYAERFLPRPSSTTASGATLTKPFSQEALLRQVAALIKTETG